MIRCGIIIPVYRHAKPVEEVLARLDPYGLPCIVVDDWNTPPLADSLSPRALQQKGVSVIRLPEHGGKGLACLAGARHAATQGWTHAIFMDADNQHDAGDIPHILALIDKHPAAMIIGQPQFDASAPRARRFGRLISNVWVWIETGSFAIRDSLCGFRALPLGPVLDLAAREPLGLRMDFDPDLLVRLYWRGLPVVNFPTRVRYPAGGVSNFDVWRDNLALCRLHTRLVLTRLARIGARG